MPLLVFYDIVNNFQKHCLKCPLNISPDLLRLPSHGLLQSDHIELMHIQIQQFINTSLLQLLLSAYSFSACPKSQAKQFTMTLQ